MGYTTVLFGWESNSYGLHQTPSLVMGLITWNVVTSGTTEQNRGRDSPTGIVELSKCHAFGNWQS